MGHHYLKTTLIPPAVLYRDEGAIRTGLRVAGSCPVFPTSMPK